MSNQVKPLPKGAFYDTRIGIPLEHALDNYAASNGSAVGVWHVAAPYDHLIFNNEADARAYISSYISSCNPREVQYLKPSDFTDPTSNRRYRGERGGEGWRVRFPRVGLEDKPESDEWITFRLYQRTEEMERGRHTEERKLFEQAVVEAKAAFERVGPVFCDSWEGHLSQNAQRWGRHHGLIEGIGRDARWIGATSAGHGLQGEGL